MRLQVLMPMGGLGSRFTAAGYTTPKPLIEVDGKPMFMRALDSYCMIEDVHHIFVVRKDQDEAYDLAANIRAVLPDADIVILDHDTRGAVETCMAAADLIDDTLPISIADCDIYFESKDYFEGIRAGSTGDGMLLTFTSDDPRYSYVEVSAAGEAIRTAEKVVISPNAILGGYFFKDGALFKQLAREFLGKPLPDTIKEFYLSHLFNLLIAQDGIVRTAKIDKKYIFGTPDELEAYRDGKQD